MKEIWTHYHYVDCRSDDPEQFRAIGWVKGILYTVIFEVREDFTNKGEMKPPVKRVNVDFTLDMLKELDAIAKDLNISRQAVIKTYLRQALDQHYIARQTQG